MPHMSFATTIHVWCLQCGASQDLTAELVRVRQFDGLCTLSIDEDRIEHQLRRLGWESPRLGDWQHGKCPTP